MSVRVVARIRPLLKAERDADIIVRTGSSAAGDENATSNTVRIPNPKNEVEDFTFQFHNVYDQEATQEQIFQAEVAPTIKHLFNGFDVTLFAYGVTGTGKTHTMRGGKSLAERGVIPRLLSGIYRRSRKIEKDSQGGTSAMVTMSYYEIYNDRVFDLFEPPEKRTATGLPLREQNGKTIVVGLTERPCSTLKDFERLYDQANVNRSTSATKLNAHSSRSHAILCVKVTVTTGSETRVSTASAIDLAGSEDNRRTENGKERLVESASINKSLFVLAQCVEAITKKQSRVPYRESKMTRILSLGQNNGLTIMILNLAPVRSYHLDSLSSLNFANRTKKVEVKEIENEPMFKGSARTALGHQQSLSGSTIQRQPLRPVPNAENMLFLPPSSSKPTTTKPTRRPAKAFSVYSDGKTSKTLSNIGPTASGNLMEQNIDAATRKRKGDSTAPPSTRPTKLARQDQPTTVLSHTELEQMVERKVEEVLAARALSTESAAPVQAISEQVQRRLDALEQKIGEKEDGNSEGLNFLLMAKQHHVRGEFASALKMYQLAQPFFPQNEALSKKMLGLQSKLQSMKKGEQAQAAQPLSSSSSSLPLPPPTPSVPSSLPTTKDKGAILPKLINASETLPASPSTASSSSSSSSSITQPPNPATEQTPRTTHLLRILNSRDVRQIKALKGVGPKKAEVIVEGLRALERERAVGVDVDGAGDVDVQEGGMVVLTSLDELVRMKGVGAKLVEGMRGGLDA